MMVRIILGKLGWLGFWVFISLHGTIKHQFVRSLANEAQNRFAFDKIRDEVELDVASHMQEEMLEHLMNSRPSKSMKLLL